MTIKELPLCRLGCLQEAACAVGPAAVPGPDCLGCGQDWPARVGACLRLACLQLCGLSSERASQGSTADYQGRTGASMQSAASVTERDWRRCAQHFSQPWHVSWDAARNRRDIAPHPAGEARTASAGHDPIAVQHVMTRK